MNGSSSFETHWVSPGEIPEESITIILVPVIYSVNSCFAGEQCARRCPADQRAESTAAARPHLEFGSGFIHATRPFSPLRYRAVSIRYFTRVDLAKRMIRGQNLVTLPCEYETWPNEPLTTPRKYFRELQRYRFGIWYQYVERNEYWPST